MIDIIIELFKISIYLGLAGIALVVGMSVVKIVTDALATGIVNIILLLSKIFGWFMYKVKFFTQDLEDKTRNQTNEVFFDEIDEAVIILIKTQIARLELTLKNVRVLCLIENLETVW